MAMCLHRIKSSDDADNKPYIDAPMNFEIHRADTSPDTYEADNESQQQEDLPFEDAVTDRKKSVVSEPEEDLPPFQDEEAGAKRSLIMRAKVVFTCTNITFNHQQTSIRLIHINLNQKTRINTACHGNHSRQS